MEERTCDVLVCGAGIAGVAAALEASRSDLRTLMVEKTVFPGGLATSGLVNIYLPICDGNGTQVSFGLAEELLKRCMQYGPGQVPPGWRELHDGPEPDRYRTAFSPASYVLALDEVLEQAGVQLLFDALACTPVLDGNRVAGVEIENKSGRSRILADCVIDATGDADIAFRAGVPCVQGVNRLSLWAIEETGRSEGARTTRGQEHGPAVTRMDGGKDRSYSGTDGDDVSAFLLDSRRLLRKRCQARYEMDPGLRETFYPVTLPAMAQYRTTRRIVGQVTLQPGEAWRSRPDSVGLVADWRRPGSVWEVPYGALLPPPTFANLLVAGRCMAAAADAWQVTRVIPAAAVTGQACGAAAALAVRRRTAPSDLAIADLQQALVQRGIPVRLETLYSADTLRLARAPMPEPSFSDPMSEEK